MYLKLDKKYLGTAETSLKARYMKVYEVHRSFTVVLGLKNQGVRFIIKRRIVAKIKFQQRISCYYVMQKEMTAWIDVCCCIYFVFIFDIFFSFMFRKKFRNYENSE